MPNAKFPSRFSPDITVEPYSTWFNKVQNEKEFFHLLRIIRGIPVNWIIWVEKETKKKIDRGVFIRDPLNYRIQFLNQGIIQLQESKFILDIIENSLRQSFGIFTISHNVKFNDLKIPNFRAIRKKYESVHKEIIKMNEIIPEDFVFQFTFGDLIQIFYANWVISMPKNDQDFGLGDVFKKELMCRNKYFFMKNFEVLRNNRNKIAHSNKLFTVEETKKIYDLSYLWLKSLEIDLDLKINIYREYRPKFLEKIYKN